MKDQSNGPPRSQKRDCLRPKAITEHFNPIHSQERLGVVFHLIFCEIMILVRTLISGMESSLVFDVILQIASFKSKYFQMYSFLE